MARGRMLSSSISEDFEFNAMSLEAKMLFMMAIPHLDRDGLISGHVAILQGRICPLMPELLPKMQAIIDEWAAAGLVVPYMSGRAPALFFTGFSKNQSGMRYEREAPSTFEPPPGYTRTTAGLIPLSSVDTPPSNGTPPPPMINESGTNPESVRSSAGANPPEVEVKGKGIEGKGIGSAAESAPYSPPPSTATNNSQQLFDPRKLKGGKVAAGRGSTPCEVLFEFVPYNAQRLAHSVLERVAQEITDLDKWRSTLEECAALGWQPYNVADRLDVYRNGFRWKKDGPPRPDADATSPSVVVMPAAARALAERAANLAPQ